MSSKYIAHEVLYNSLTTYHADDQIRLTGAAFLLSAMAPRIGF
jgi:hypothetical protein